MRKNQISAVKVAEWEAENSSIRWGAAIAGLFVAILIFTALATLTMGLTAQATNNSLLIPFRSPELRSASKMLLFFLYASGAIALFAGAFISARSSGAVTTRVGRTEGLVITAMFLFFVATVGFFGNSISPQFRAISSSIDVEQINIAENREIKSAIAPKLKGLELDRPIASVTEGIMKRLLVDDDLGAYEYLSERARIPQNEARRRIEPIRASVKNGFMIASVRSAYIARLIGFFISGAILLGSLAAMAGGTLGARMSLRAPLSRYDRETLDETLAA